MVNFKLFKSSTAIILGVSVLTTTVVVPGIDSSAKAIYKTTSKGILVNSKTNNQGSSSSKIKKYNFRSG